MDKKRNRRILTTVGPSTLWLTCFIVLPILYIVGISFIPMENRHFVLQFTLNNYKTVFSALYLSVYANSFLIAFLNTALCILFGYPMAYIIATAASRKRKLYITLLMLPFYTNSIVRLGGWKVLLGRTGYFNKLMLHLHLIHEPITMMYTTGAVVLGMVYILLPFMVLPLISSISTLDKTLLEASQDLGASKVQTFFRVTLPLTKQGIFSGSIMVFIPTMAYFYISDYMGGAKHKVIGNTIQTQFQQAYNWPVGAAFAVMLLVMTLILVGIYKKSGGEASSLAIR